MLVDIVILPPSKIRNLVGRAIVKAVGNLKYVYLIDNKKLIPHISFFHINIHKRKLPAIFNIVKNSSASFRPVKIFSKGVLVDGQGVWFSLSNHKSLINFNQQMVKYGAPLRDGLIPWIPKHLPNSRQKYNRQKYGTHYCIGPGFNPHFTMVKLKQAAEAAIVADRLKPIKFSFWGKTIAVCQITKYGQVTKVLKTFKLS